MTDPTSVGPPSELVLDIPRLSLVVLIGVSGSGKSTWARRAFPGTMVLSSDHFRGLVSDDENDQSATADAFASLEFVAARRLAAGRTTVIDATSVQPAARKSLVALARAHDVLPVAVVLDVGEQVCLQRNTSRSDRTGVTPAVVRRQSEQLRRGIRGLDREGFRVVHRLSSVAEVDAARVRLTRMLTDFTEHDGPFDIIGDVHGCLAELLDLLRLLGYALVPDVDGRPVDASHPDGRTVIFVGDLVDRGPDTPGVLRLAMGMAAAGHAMVVPGNHEDKLVRALSGRKVTVSHGLETTLAQLAAEPEGFRREIASFCRALVSHRVLDGGRLVVAHAGMKQDYQGRASSRVRAFALYGETTGETDEFGLPVRLPWAQEYRGPAAVVYGHTPTTDPEWVNNTLCVDTGCCFGGRLTALRYPERERVSVPARAEYYAPARPLAAAVPDRPPQVLELTDVLGRRGIETAGLGRVTIREEYTAGALEVMSRWAADPRWLLYLPPTMAPAPTAPDGPMLERPEQAFADYLRAGVREVSCQIKHMGSRAVALLRREGAPVGVPDGTAGMVHTRTGRPFFPGTLGAELAARLRAAAETAGLFDELAADWLLLDAELLPWSAKGDELIRDTFAAAGAAARAGSAAELAVLAVARRRLGGLPEPTASMPTASMRTASADLTELGALTDRLAARAGQAEVFTRAYRQYSARTGVARGSLDGVALAPFQLLAGTGAVYATRDQRWHLAVADRLAAADPGLITRTDRMEVRTDDEVSVAAGVRWWEEVVADGAEGIVVKPMASAGMDRHPAEPGRAGDGKPGGGRRAGPVQPGLKVRGPDYLTLVYGSGYREPAILGTHRGRDLRHKRSQALREYALGLEGLRRAAAGEPLWRVHECVFAVLALESEPVDPRL